MFNWLWQYIVLGLVILWIILGLITFLLPIPLGFLMLVTGLAALITISPTARGWFTSLRNRYPFIDDRLSRVEPHLPEALRKALRPDS